MDILKELAQRCMVQDIENNLEGDVVWFRIHDLVRDFCIKKANEEGFFQVSSASTQFKCYRTIINDGEPLALENSHLRTLVYLFTRLPRSFSFETLKLLRVLSLRFVKLGESSKHIGNMVLLRYLKLENCCSEVENVYFIKRLANLQFLFIKELDDRAIAQKLPDDMVSKMEQLRVLDIYLWRCNMEDLSTTILSGVANLRNLQRLRLDPSFQGLGEELQLGRSIDLRELELHEINSQQHLDAICDCVTNNFLPQLHVLKLQTKYGLGFDVQKMEWGRCQHLKYLDLSGKMIKPDKPWLPPPKLLSLYLWGTEIEDQEDMDRVINPRLHHLRELFVSYNVFNGDKLTLVGLPQLEKLDLYGLENFKEWRIAQDSLPELRDLRIEDCHKLERIPHEIGNIHNLRTVYLSGRNEGLKKRLEKREEGATQGGEDLHLLHNIPTIEYASRLFQRRKKQKDKHQRQIKESLALDNLHLRTLVYIGREDSPRLSPFERLKLLRLPSLEDVKLGESSKHIGNMVLLRYLKLEECCSEVENIYFIKRLANLQFLFIREYNDPAIAQKLPDDMVSKMEQLRVLEIVVLEMPGVVNLRNLQRLRLNPSFQGLSKELQLARSIDLRALELRDINSQQQLDAICDCVTNNFLPHLQSLALGQSGLGFDMQKMEWGRCQHLKFLDLSGKMIKPDKPWLPPKLLSLSIWRTEIEDQEHMDRVINPRLHHLRELFVYFDAFIGAKLTLVGFPQLEKLELYGLDNLKEWRITQDSLPKLRDLGIRNCPKLERIPHEIGNIHNLRTLTLTHIGGNEGLKKRLEKREEGATQGGEDLHLLHNIPAVIIS
ncbi:hypothetical protein V2J09_017232 [Rumex salicifolius]